MLKFKLDILDDETYSRFFLALGTVSFWLWSVFVTPLSGTDVIDFGRAYIALYGLLVVLFANARTIYVGSLIGYLYLITHYYYLIYLNYENPHKIEYLIGLNMILCLCNLVFVRKYQVLTFYIYSFVGAFALLYKVEHKYFLPILFLTIFAVYLSTIGAIFRIKLIAAIKKKTEENLHLQAGILHSSKMASLGEMAGGIAHEINNPIQVILGNTQFLMKQYKDDPRLPKIRENAYRIASIVASVKILSRGGGKDEGRDIKDLSELINNALNLCRRKISNRNINLIVEGDVDTKIGCQPSEIIQVILNLVVNAYEAIDRSCPDQTKEERIRIVCKKIDGNVEVVIWDSAPEIPDNVVDRFFLPFFTTKPVGKGPGLGLATSRTLAEKNGGTLVFKKETKEFVLTMPVFATATIGNAGAPKSAA
jgi:signal transduction histidine kinase